MPELLFQECLQNNINVVRADKRSGGGVGGSGWHDSNLTRIPSPNRRHSFLSQESYYKLRDWTINVAQNTSPPVEETYMLTTVSCRQ